MMDFEEKKKVDITVAIVAHLTLIGWIVAVIINNNKTDREKAFGAFYLRQVLGLIFLALFVSLADMIIEQVLGIIPFIGPVLYWLTIPALYVGIFVFWILSLIAAANHEEKELPFIGKPIQNIFRNAFE